ncbi:unnamed protein product [Hermetia illucens]|uniref:Uncharacterized protein n=1 Tax=Hermetia illucens TaxID=343691 RepID=A0A7R8V5M1_HERIL|nr:unnamed protein product [Hermetia illucens]
MHSCIVIIVIVCRVILKIMQKLLYTNLRPHAAHSDKLVCTTLHKLSSMFTGSIITSKNFYKMSVKWKDTYPPDNVDSVIAQMQTKVGKVIDMDNQHATFLLPVFVFLVAWAHRGASTWHRSCSSSYVAKPYIYPHMLGIIQRQVLNELHRQESNRYAAESLSLSITTDSLTEMTTTNDRYHAIKEGSRDGECAVG